MASAEPILPLDATSALVIARDQIVDCVDEWSQLYRAARTIGHAGKVTQEYLFKQSGKGLRSIITVMGGTNERLSGGKSTQFDARWAWFIVVPGTIENRTSKGLLVGSEAVRFITRDVWGNLPDSAFSRTPRTVEIRAMYQDKDEINGLSVWMLSWTQAIDLGTAGRPRTPGPDPLLQIGGTDVVEAEPNPDDIDTLVE
jgi:hypothetical protein